MRWDCFDVSFPWDQCIWGPLGRSTGVCTLTPPPSLPERPRSPISPRFGLPYVDVDAAIEPGQLKHCSIELGHRVQTGEDGVRVDHPFWREWLPRDPQYDVSNNGGGLPAPIEDPDQSLRLNLESTEEGGPKFIELSIEPQCYEPGLQSFRWVGVVAYGVAILTVAALTNSWQHYSLILIEGGAYEWLCEAHNTERFHGASCLAQEKAVGDLMTWNNMAQFGSALAAGVLIDNFGRRTCLVMGSLIAWLSVGLLILAGPSFRQGFLLSTILEGSKNNMIAFPCLCLMDYFPHHPALSSSFVMTAEFLGVIPCIVMWYFWVLNPQWTSRQLWGTYLGCIMVPLCLIYIATTPPNSYSRRKCLEEALRKHRGGAPPHHMPEAEHQDCTSIQSLPGEGDGEFPAEVRCVNLDGPESTRRRLDIEKAYEIALRRYINSSPRNIERTQNAKCRVIIRRGNPTPDRLLGVADDRDGVSPALQVSVTAPPLVFADHCFASPHNLWPRFKRQVTAVDGRVSVSSEGTAAGEKADADGESSPTTAIRCVQLSGSGVAIPPPVLSPPMAHETNRGRIVDKRTDTALIQSHDDLEHCGCRSPTQSQLALPTQPLCRRAERTEIFVIPVDDHRVKHEIRRWSRTTNNPYRSNSFTDLCSVHSRTSSIVSEIPALRRSVWKELTSADFTLFMICYGLLTIQHTYYPAVVRDMAGLEFSQYLGLMQLTVPVFGITIGFLSDYTNSVTAFFGISFCTAAIFACALVPGTFAAWSALVLYVITHSYIYSLRFPFVKEVFQPDTRGLILGCMGVLSAAVVTVNIPINRTTNYELMNAVMIIIGIFQWPLLWIMRGRYKRIHRWKQRTVPSIKMGE